MIRTKQANEDRNMNLSALKVGLFFAFLFFLTLSRNLSLAHDASTYYKNIISGEPYFHPHHLWYEPLTALILNAVLKIFPDAPALIVAQSVNACAGGALVAVFYKILRQRLFLDVNRALLTCGVFGFSFSIWAYATTIEVCLIPLVLLFTGFFIATPTDRRGLSFGRACAIGALHGVAMLFHQIHFLFGFAYVFMIMGDPFSAFSRKFRNLLMYLLVGSVIVVCAYGYAAHSIGVSDSVENFKKWFFAYAAREEYYSRPVWQSAALLLGGWARTLINGYFTLGLDTVFSFLTKNDFVSGGEALNTSEDRYFFLYREIPDLALSALSFFSVVIGLLCLAFLGSRLFGKKKFQPMERLLLITAVPYFVFFSIWEPFNPEFHMVQWIVCCAVLIGGAALADRWVFVTAALLFAVNGIGHIIPSMSLQNDFYYQSLKTLQAPAGKKIFALSGSNWIYGNYFSIYRPDIEFCGVADQDCDEPLEKALREEKIIYVRRDACVKPHPKNRADVTAALAAICPAIVKRDQSFVAKTKQLPPPDYLFYQLPVNSALYPSVAESEEQWR